MWIDNSMIDQFLRCPRKYLFRYLLHWAKEESSAALTFGTCWHKSQSVIAMLREQWKSGQLQDADIAALALKAFVECWEEHGLDPEEYHPRSLTTARRQIPAFIQWSRSWQFQLKALAIEEPGVIEILPGIQYVSKMDEVVEFELEGRGIAPLEHKTSAKLDRTFCETFRTARQIGGYLISTMGLYGEERVGKALVCAALVAKNPQDADFKLLPQYWQSDNLEQWLQDSKRWIADIQRDHLMYEETSPDASTCAAFPRKPTACSDWFSICEYMDECVAYANPKGKPLPSRFIVKPWLPAKELGLE